MIPPFITDWSSILWERAGALIPKLPFPGRMDFDGLVDLYSREMGAYISERVAEAFHPMNEPDPSEETEGFVRSPGERFAATWDDLELSEELDAFEERLVGMDYWSLARLLKKESLPFSEPRDATGSPMTHLNPGIQKTGSFKPRLVPFPPKKLPPPPSPVWADEEPLAARFSLGIEDGSDFAILAEQRGLSLSWESGLVEFEEAQWQRIQALAESSPSLKKMMRVKTLEWIRGDHSEELRRAVLNLFLQSPTDGEALDLLDWIRPWQRNPKDLLELIPTLPGGDWAALIQALKESFCRLGKIDHKRRLGLPEDLHFPALRVELPRQGQPVPLLLRQLKFKDLPVFFEGSELSAHQNLFDRTKAFGEDIFFVVAHDLQGRVEAASSNMWEGALGNLVLTSFRTEKKDLNRASEVKGLGLSLLVYRLWAVSSLTGMDDDRTVVTNIYDDVLNSYKRSVGMPANPTVFGDTLTGLTGREARPLLKRGIKRLRPSLIRDTETRGPAPLIPSLAHTMPYGALQTLNIPFHMMNSAVL